MLPFAERTWAKPVAKSMIVITLLAEVIAILWLRHYHPLDPPEIVGLLLILIGILPPNIHILRLRPGAPASGARSNPAPFPSANSPT